VLCVWTRRRHFKIKHWRPASFVQCTHARRNGLRSAGDISNGRARNEQAASLDLRYRHLQRIGCSSDASRIPWSPQATLTVRVGYECGLGVHRAPLGACVPVYVYRGYDPYYRGYVRGYYRGYRRGYYEGRRDAYYPYVRYVPGDVIAVDRGVCGFGSYLSCSYGTCWRFCQ
jgi:hypothetical protein